MSCDLFAWALHKTLGYQKFARVFVTFRSVNTGEVYENTEHIVVLHPSRRGFVVDDTGVTPIDKIVAELHNSFAEAVAEAKATGKRCFWGDDILVGAGWKPCTFGKCVNALRWEGEEVYFPRKDLTKAIAFILKYKKHYT